MKNIAIFGSARSGKSTLSKMIVKKFPNYQIYVGDDIRGAFDDVFPALDINSRGGSGMIDAFPRYVSDLFHRSIKRNIGVFNYIVETCDIKPEKAKELFERDDTIVLFLGVSNITIEKHFQDIRKYETKNDWTYDRTDDNLLKHCSYWIPESKKIKEECERLNLWYVDTSTNREEVLEKTLIEIEKIIRQENNNEKV